MVRTATGGGKPGVSQRWGARAGGGRRGMRLSRTACFKSKQAPRQKNFYRLFPVGQHDVVPKLWLVAPLKNGCHRGTARTSPCPPALEPLPALSQSPAGSGKVSG